MGSSRLTVLKPYAHLEGNIDHVVLDGTAADVRKQDIVLDGMYWVKSISDGKHDNQDAVTFQLAVLDMPGLSFGRLVLYKHAPMVFARPVEFETWDPQATDQVDDDFSESIATMTCELARGDFVGWIDGDPLDVRSPTRTRRVNRVYANGLIEFEDGAYQSEPGHSWYVLNIETADV